MFIYIQGLACRPRRLDTPRKHIINTHIYIYKYEHIYIYIHTYTYVYTGAGLQTPTVGHFQKIHQRPSTALASTSAPKSSLGRISHFRANL